MTNPLLVANVHDMKVPSFMATIGDGVTSLGTFTVNYDKPLNKLLEEVKKKYSAVYILEGNYSMKGKFYCDKNNFKIMGAGSAIINIDHTDSVGFLDVPGGYEGTVVEGLEFRWVNPVSGQSCLKYGANGMNHTVHGNKFVVHTSTTYQAVSIASPMRLIDMVGVVGKTITRNNFLPYSGVECIYLENGNSAEVANNRFHNGFSTDLDTLNSSTFLVFPFLRPCKAGIKMDSERHGWVHHNYMWALGATITNTSVLGTINQEFMDGGIIYDHASATECGHMDISDNQIEMCAVDRAAIWLKGLRFSKINNNTTGIPQAPLTIGADTEAALVIEGVSGATGTKSDHLTLVGNQFHNPGVLNSNAAGVYIRNCDDVFFADLHLSLVFCKYGLKIASDATNIVVRNMNVSYAPDPTAPVPVDISGNADKIVIGGLSVSGMDAASATMIVNSSSGTNIWVEGIAQNVSGAISGQASAAAFADVSTNIRMSL